MSRNFTLSELIVSKTAQALTIDNTPPKELLPVLDATMAGLERVRAYLKHPIKINSGYRSYKLNRAVGGSQSSQHMRGEAIDFICPGYGPPNQVFRYLAGAMEILGIDQLILEKTWVHISFSNMPRYHILREHEGAFVLGIGPDYEANEKKS